MHHRYSLVVPSCGKHQLHHNVHCPVSAYHQLGHQGAVSRTGVRNNNAPSAEACKTGPCTTLKIYELSSLFASSKNSFARLASACYHIIDARPLNMLSLRVITRSIHRTALRSAPVSFRPLCPASRPTFLPSSWKPALRPSYRPFSTSLSHRDSANESLFNLSLPRCAATDMQDQATKNCLRRSRMS